MENIKNKKTFKKIQKTLIYSRIRQLLSKQEMYVSDDREHLPEAEKVLMDWPEGVKKPIIAVIKDYDPYPRWTKLCRFLDNNDFPYEFYDLHAPDWLEKAQRFDVFVGILSSERYHLEEMQRKFYIIETILGKKCFPSFCHIFLYENKTLEAYISQANGIPFAPTHIFNNKQDAMNSLEKLKFPVVSKIDPGSGSMGVELIHSRKQARRVINQVFSSKGRATHSLYFRQKNYIYFQDFIPNDGYDIRVILVNNWAFGYYRKVLDGDFRASGMNLVEKRKLPAEAIMIARNANKMIKSPLLVMDMVHGLDGQYHVIEFSPICQMQFPEQLHVDGIPGVYIIEDDGRINFKEGKYWVHELALREFIKQNYLPDRLGENR